MENNLRIVNHPIFGNQVQKHVTFFFNGRPIEGVEGEPVAAALMAQGIRGLRYDRITKEPRGVYCGIGHCYECRVTVDEVRDVRSCLVSVQEGLTVVSQDGWGRTVLMNESSLSSQEPTT